MGPVPEEEVASLLKFGLPLLLVVALLGSACSSSPAPPAPPPTAPPAAPPSSAPDRTPDRTPSAEAARPPAAGGANAVVARIGDDEIRASDVGEFVIRYFRDQANEALTHLVDEHILAIEAERNGIHLPPGLVEAETDREMESRAKAARMKFGGEVTLERYLRERYGQSVEEHRRDVARLVRTRLLRDRVIRYEQVRETLVTARFADFATFDDARRAADAARSGADFARLAEAEALRPAIAPPPLGKEEVAPADLAESLFALPAGGIAGPVAVEGEGKTVYRVARVVERRPAREASFSEVSAEIERGLAEKPLEQWEYVRWARQVREAFRAELLR